MQVEETTQSTPLRPTRAGFVRGLPLSMPVEEVIERGREAGIQLQPSDIHAARYYMRQQGAPEGASVPQQLMLGGTFVAKREPNRSNGTGGSKAKSDALEKTGVVEKMADADDEFEDDAPPAIAPLKRRKIVHSKATMLAKEEANGANGVALHDRLQARLANATFRETTQKAKEERAAARKLDKEQRRAQKQAERLAARQEREKEREQARLQAREEQRETERQSQRQTARAKQERQQRQQRQERLEKATIGKALLDADAVKSRNKRAQSIAVLEEQARLISLRLGTQRVRELLDAMEALARQA